MISKNQIKYIQSLHQKKQRELEQCFIVEGIKLVTEFMKHSTFELLEIYATAAFLESSQFEKKYLSTYTICEISDDELKKISLQSTPNAILAIAKQNKLVLNTTYLSTGLNLYLDDIRDPGNLGTIIRIADWFGIKQIICSPTTTELYNPKTIQASMGAVLRVNIVHETFDKIEAQLNTIPITSIPFFKLLV